MSSKSRMARKTRHDGLVVGVAVASPFALLVGILPFAAGNPEPWAISLAIASLVAGATVGWLLGPVVRWRPGHVPWRTVLVTSAIAVTVGSYVTGGLVL